MKTLPESMQVVVVEGPQSVSLRKVECPVPQPGEILIKIDHCLLCTWEQRMFSGKARMQFPFIPGHEVSGTVAYIPEETITSFSLGDKVTMKTLDSCGHCEACYRGDDNLCTGKAKKRIYDGIPSSGGLGQYICLPVSRVYHIPDQSIDLRHAAFAEPLACCIHSVEMANIELAEDVVVVGAGIMGLFHVALCVKKGARVCVVEPNEERAQLARTYGAQFIINPFVEDPLEKIRSYTGGRGVHVVFTTITQTSLAQSYIEVLTKKGRIIFYGSFHPDDDISLNPNMIHYSERIITGSYSPTSTSFWVANRLISFGIIDVSPFLSADYSLVDAQTAFEHALSPSTYRVCITMT